MQRKTIILLFLTLFIFSFYQGLSAHIGHGDSLTKAPPLFDDIKKDDSKDGGLWETFLSWNRDVQSTIAGYMTRMQKSFSLPIFLLIFLISIVYGFLHASGPGHGKMLVASYLLDRGLSLGDAAKLAGIISSIHIGSAFLLATIFQIIFTAIPDPNLQADIRSYFTIGSGIFIILIGYYSIYEKIRKKHHEKEPDLNNKKSLLMIGIAAGIVPCPMATAIMLLSVSFGIYYVGALSVLGISLGMFGLLFLIGIVTIKSRQRLEEKLNQRQKAKAIFIKATGIFSAVIIIIFGFLITIYGSQIM